MKYRFLTILAVAVAAATSAAHASDWPQWAGQNSRNMVSSEKGLPDSFAVPSADSDGVDPGKNVRWSAKLGSRAYSSPVVADGKVFVGASSDASYDPRRKVHGGGAIICFDEKTGNSSGS